MGLLYMAWNSFSSIQATFRYWYRPDIMDQARARWAVKQPPGSVSTHFYRALPWGIRLSLWLSEFFKRGSQAQEESKTIERELLFLWRVWLQKPSRWRYETQKVGQEASISVIDGEHWWYYDPTSKVMETNVMPRERVLRIHKRQITPSDDLISIEHAINQIPALDPSFLLASHTLQVTREMIYRGREAVQVKAIPRKSKEWVVPETFWIEADEYELLVDKERGILLRYSAKLEGHEYAVVSAESVVFDEPIPESIFSLHYIPDPNITVYVVEE